MNRSNFEVLTLRFAFVSLIAFIGATVQPFALPVVVSALLGIVTAFMVRKPAPQPGMAHGH